MPKAFKQRLIQAIVSTATMLLLGAVAKADTVFLKDEPPSKITASDAAKSKTPVFECQLVQQGPNINPVKVKGSKTVWSSNPGETQDTALDALTDGGTAWRCKSKLRDRASGRMKTAEPI